MFGLDLSLSQTAMRTHKGYYFDFTTGVRPSQLSVARASGGTGFDENGLLVQYGSDVPRFDRSSSAQTSAGLKIEDSSTNLVELSSIAVGDWTPSSTTTTALSLNALGVFPGLSVGSTGASWHRLNHSIGVASTATYTGTIYFRYGTSGALRVVMRNPSNSTESSMVIDASAMTVTSSLAGAITPVAQMLHLDGLTRIVTFQFTPSFTGSCLFGLGPQSGATGETVVLLGAQVEVGTAATSFIVTSGTQETRAADTATLNGIFGVFDVTWIDAQNATNTLNGETVSDGYWPIGATGVIQSIALTPSA